MAATNSLEIQRHALDYWQIVRNRLGLITLCFVFIFAAASVITYIMPRKYRGRVEMVIERTAENARVVGTNAADPLNFAGTENFLKTQFEIITKRRTLDRVVEKYDLVNRWKLPSRQAAAGRLLANLDPQSSIKSDFVVIEYYDEDPKLAAELANAVADSYKETRLEAENARINSAIEQLDIQIAAKTKDAHAAFDHSMKLKREGNVVELPANENNRAAGRDDVSTPEQAMLQENAREVHKAEIDISLLEGQVKQLQALEGDDLIRQTAELRIENRTILADMPAYQQRINERELKLNSGLGPKHPTILGLDSAIAKTRDALLAAAQDYRKSLSFRIQTAKDTYADAQRRYDSQRTKILDVQSGSQEYLAAKREWDLLQADVTRLMDTRAQKQIELGTAKTPMTVYQPAEPEGKPLKPNIKLNLALGGIVGLLFGFGLAFFLEYLDTSVKSMDEVEKHLGIPVLAVVPKGVGVLAHSTGMTPDSEAYRILRTNLEFNRKDPSANCISVVSGSPGEGKSTTMVNLATICALGGYTTLIIDGDMRRPRQHSFFGVSHSFGLSNYLTSEVPLEEVVIQTQVANLYLMPSGVMPADSAGLLNSQKFSDLLADVKSRFDIVLIDSPPILGVSDASVLCAQADLTMIVIQHRKLPRQMLDRVKQNVEQVGGTIVGAVLNNVDINSDATYGYYTSYYGYYTEDGQGNASMKPGKKRQKSASRAVAPTHQPNDEVF
jgi:capsular exopolysaccharide synthesis family protein